MFTVYPMCAKLMFSKAAQQQSGPPYAPHNASLGGRPDIIPDIPVTAVFLFLYVVFGIIHIKIFKKNKARGHKFVFNGALFGTFQLPLFSQQQPLSLYLPRTRILPDTDNNHVP